MTSTAWHELVLPRGYVLLVDDQDWDFVQQHKWHAVPARKTHYAQTIIDQWPHSLHAMLLKPAPGLVVDHKNHNGLDNRRDNLRTCTQSQNKANITKFKNNTSGYKGVSWNKRRRKWYAAITVNYRTQHLGVYDDPWEAAQAYNRAALEAWGEFALLNEKHD